MLKVDAKLALWKESYAKLNEARIAVKANPANPSLKAEVERLQVICGEALEAMQAELARVKSRGNSEQGVSRP